MKNFRFTLLLTLLFSSSLSKSQGLLYINAINGNSITCSNPVVFLQAMHNLTVSSSSFSWTGPGGQSGTGPSFNAATPGLYMLMANTSGGLFFDSLAVFVNTTAPVSAVSPTLQNITCNPASILPVTLTAVTPTTSIGHYVMSATGGTMVANTSTFAFLSQSAGVYTYVLTNITNGCSTSKTFTQISSQGYPTFSLTSLNNFSLGCSTKSIDVINIINANTTPIGGAVSFTLLNPGTSTTLPFGTLSIVSVYSLSTPGTYTAIVKDNVTYCETRIPFSVVINTAGPALAGINGLGNQVLSCATPSTTLTAISQQANTSYNWQLPGNPVVSLASASLAVSANFTVPSTNTVIGFYTLTLTDPNSTCLTNTTVAMFQNTYKPNASVVATPTAFTCLTPTVVLTNQSSTGIPLNSIFPKNLPVSGWYWQGPSVVPPASLASTYYAMVPGTYTMIAKDLNNGCESTTVITIGDSRDYPNVSMPNIYTILCPGGTAFLTPIVTPSTALSYTWMAPSGAIVGPTNQSVLQVSSPGYYTLSVTNTLSGCSTNSIISVWACVGLEENSSGINATIYPNPGKGIFTVKLDQNNLNTKATVFNLLGELVFEQALSTGANTLRIDAPVGIYYVKLENPTGKKTVKLIKE